MSIYETLKKRGLETDLGVIPSDSRVSVPSGKEGSLIAGKGLQFQPKAPVKFIVPERPTPLLPDKPKQIPAEQLNEVGSFNIPIQDTVAPDNTSVGGYLSRIKGEAEAEAKIKEEEIKKFETGDRADEQRSVLDRFLNRRGVGEERERLQEETGVDLAEYNVKRAAQRASLEGMMNEYTNKETQKKEALLGTERQYAGRLTSAFRGEQSMVEKRFNIELSQISSKMKTQIAMMEIEKGDFTTAKNFIDEAIADYTYDLKTEYEQYDMFRDENQDTLNELKDEHKDALDKAEEASFEIWKDKENEVKQVGDLMLSAPKAGITFNDTVEEATVKAVQWSKLQPDTKTTAAGEKISRLGGITTTLEASRGTDGFVDPDIYLEQRAASDVSSSDFDNRFSYLLNPADKERLGFTTKEITKAQKESIGWTWLGSDEAIGLTDEQKAQVIMSKIGLNPETFGLFL